MDMLKTPPVAHPVAVPPGRPVIPDDKPLRPAPLPPLSGEDVVSATEHDKKNTGSRRVMVFPRAIGQCIVEDASEDDIRYGIATIGL